MRGRHMPTSSTLNVAIRFGEYAHKRQNTAALQNIAVPAHTFLALRFDRGRSGIFSRPSLRTGRADLPHPALRLALCSIAETGKIFGSERFQVQEPELCKVAVAPALMIASSAAACASSAFAQDRAQSSAHPCVGFL